MTAALSPGEIHLWLVRPPRAAAPDLQDAYRALLSPEERTRYLAFRAEERRHEYQVTRALVRTTLSRYGELAPAAWRFTANRHGRPELDPDRGLRFNLSNGPDLVACALARGPVGVDVEPCARAGTILSLAARIFSGEERRALDALAPQERPDRALSLWTLKEAYLKARGTGLSLPLEGLTFSLGPERAARAGFGPAIGDDPERWRFALLDRGGHRLALAAEGPIRLSAWETVPLEPGADAPLDLVGGALRERG